MSLRSKAIRRGRPPRPQVYRQRFLSDIQFLIGQGFQTLSHLDLVSEEEPAITGLLTQAIETLLDDPQSPTWTDRYTVQDERHIHVADRRGKDRLRVDFEITSTRFRPRPRFQIEAKRLRLPVNRSLSAYLGDDGLMSFVSGRYARSQRWAGMLGYVQVDAPDSWPSLLGNEIRGASENYSVAPQTEVFCSCSFVQELPHVYRSDHLRQELAPIEVHHIFLRCC